MPYNLLSFLHIVSVILFIAVTFYAFAAPGSKSKRFVLSLTGIFSLLVVVTGFGLHPHIGGLPGWFWAKLVIWLAISAFSGVAYRRRNLADALMIITALLAALAVWLVTYRPF